ncbi:MAG TPA: metallophosphoesterase, partial [Acidimicrobiales bacterium]|nr:metallophosphoesterase [Acidimicrobiales bacterium]
GAAAAPTPRAVEPYPVRALRAAFDEAVAWGAQLLVVQGDLTNLTTAAEVRDVGRLLAASPVPVEAILGNHDNQGRTNIRGLLQRQGIAVPWQPRARDLPGLRLVLVSTAHGGARYHRGQMPTGMARRVAGLAAEASGPVWVGMHHPPERYPIWTVYPPGIPFEEGRFLIGELAKANPAVFVTCGHRHRHRRYTYGPLTLSEIGSTKDYPGTWSGYKVFEGGILQVTRRTARPDVLSWTEATRRALNGQWGRWSPGRLPDRCFTHPWPERAGPRSTG